MKHYFRYVVTALFTALTCVATYFIHIPVPMVNGYANLGDAIILLCAFLFPSTSGIAAAGIGAALADVLSGYLIYAPATLIIKAGVFAMAMLLSRRGGLFCVLAAVASELWMVLGYLFFEAIVMGLHSGAFASIPGNLVQALASVVIALVLTPVMLRSSEIKKYIHQYKEN